MPKKNALIAKKFGLYANVTLIAANVVSTKRNAYAGTLTTTRATTMTQNKDETQKRLFKWMKKVRPLVKCNAVESKYAFDHHLIEELDELIEILEKEKPDDPE